MISVQNLCKAYGPTVAVEDITFEVGKGEVVGFLGPNGAGKTTTLKILTSFLPPTSGTVSVAGYDVSKDHLEARRHLGYLPELNPLYEDMEVTEYLEWAASVRGFRGPEKVRRVRRMVEVCGLGDGVGKEIGHLSKGYRQRVGLAQAILHDPPILLLDEPTSGLDPNQTREVRDLILELKKEKTVMLSTHILPEVQASCNRILIIHKGRIVAQGDPRGLAQQAQGAVRYTLVLRRAEGQARAVEELPGVDSADIREADGEVTLEVRAKETGEDLREGLFRLAVERGWVLLELKKESRSLEEVFHQLTL